MTAANIDRLSRPQVLALRGLRLPGLALKKLRQTGIFCDPSVSIQHQSHAQRYVIRGVESGGAVQEIGAYCSFIGVGGSPLSLLQKVQSVGRNGLHAVVIAEEMVRLQMFRNEQTYQLLITKHCLEAVQGSARPALVNTVVFHGIHGTLEESIGGQMPVFRARGGDVVPIPHGFEWAVEKLAAAVLCNGCKHCHLLDVQEVAGSHSLEAMPL